MTQLADAAGQFYSWATGGDFHYRTLMECLNGDVDTAIFIVSLCAIVGAGYIVIAWRWFRESRSLEPSEAKRAMTSLMWIFLLSAVSGYFWPLIKIWWPVWKAQATLLFILMLHTWAFVMRPRLLRAISDRMPHAYELVERNELMLQDVRKLKSIFGARHERKRLESV